MVKKLFGPIFHGVNMRIMTPKVKEGDCESGCPGSNYAWQKRSGQESLPDRNSKAAYS
jgi:hypothetical protein